MQYRKDKDEKTQLSLLGMGCMRFPGTPGKIDLVKTEKLILAAIKSGINYFDTAYIYPGAEEALGEILLKNNLREKVNIATKLPQGICKSYDDFERIFEEEKKRLKADYIDFYLMHNFTSRSQLVNVINLGIERFIAEKKKTGEIRRIGFSYHGTKNDYPYFVDSLDWDFVQIQYNYVNKNYQAGEDGVKYAASKGLPIIVMEPLLGGKLASSLPKSVQKILQEADSTMTPAEWGLSWLFAQKEITVVLSGMTEASQIESNAAFVDIAAEKGFDTLHQQTIEKAIEEFEKFNKVRCTGCNYCMPCPKNINIPACFSAFNQSYAINWYTGTKQYLTAVGILGDRPAYASQCVGCGVCEKKCPQGIEIRKELKKAKHRLEKPLIKTAAKVIKKFLNKKATRAAKKNK
jgi:predicted aldo/keto reductase-like oxidoreductase